jgi:hypothetical protein
MEEKVLTRGFGVEGISRFEVYLGQGGYRPSRRLSRR